MGFEPTISRMQTGYSTAELQAHHFNFRFYFLYLTFVGGEGVEPSTSSLSEKRSAAELAAHNLLL